jgi:hypothetical protein
MNKFLPYILWAFGIVCTLTIFYAVAAISLRLRERKYLLRRKTVCLEITPPLTQSKSATANSELFNILHGFRNIRPIKDRLLGREIAIALQIVSSRDKGIRYLIEVDKRMAASLFQAITSYMPEVKVIETEIKSETKEMQVIEFKQSSHYAFPLASAKYLEEHDPVSYLTGMMTKLEPNEQMSFQLILTPIKPKEASSIAHKVLRNEDLLYSLGTKSMPALSIITGLINKLLFSITDMTGEIYHGATSQSYSSKSSHEQSQIARRQRPTRTLSAFELEIMESIHNKVNQPLFRTSLRVGVAMNSPEEAKERLSAISTSLHSYNVPSYQALQSKMNLPWLNNMRLHDFNNRLPSLFKKRTPVFSSSEIASLYHFPVGGNAKTDNLVSSLSRTLSAPVSLKQSQVLDVMIGQNEHHGTITDIGLSEAERERHVYIIGGTGNGKTTMLQYQIVQDMQNGKGLAIIDPHGDMAETMLRHLPPNRVKDVIYFNPDDIGYPIGLNLLEIPEGIDGDELLREKDLITESVISVFRKIFSDEDTGGHRIEYVLRNTIQTALTIENATLFTVFDLLNDNSYRKKIIKTLDNKDLVNFWKNELGKAGEMQRVKMAAGITAKIGRFLFSASAKRILEQPRSTIDFDDIINSGKILICNLSKGLIGEDTSELFGITVLAKLQLASLRRARIKQNERRPFYLYVDEFQNFATQSFVQMLSESRKYKLFMTMAEQSTSQQKDQQMVSIILANVGTVICFRTGNPHDERLLLPLFSPYIKQGEISNLSPFNFYAKLSATQSQEPLSGKTLLIENIEDNNVATAAIAFSRAAFARQSVVEKPNVANNKRNYLAIEKNSTKQGNKNMLDMQEA